MCDCVLSPRDIEDFQDQLKDIQDQVDSMFQSHKYKLVSQLVKPIEILELPKKIEDYLFDHDINTILDLIIRCGTSFSNTDLSKRYQYISLRPYSGHEIEEKLNPLGLSLYMHLLPEIRREAFKALHRDPKTGE